MKADFNGFSLADRREMTIEFYDPEVFHTDKDGFFEAMMGGFPSYFRITVDIQAWKVVDHYTSREQAA
jgi:hypothetical protein